MMNIKMHVTYADGSGVDVDTSMPDFIAFERKYDKPVQAFAGEVRIEYMCFLAWNNLHRRQKTDLDFDAWLDQIEEIKVGEEEDEIVPLETDQPTG